MGAKGGARSLKAKMASSRTSTPSNAASPGPPPTPSTNQPYQGDAEKRHFKVDKVDIKRASSDVRNNCVGMLYNGLAYRSTDSVEVVVGKAVEVEAAAFKHFKGEGAEYKAKIKSLFSNLKVKSNRELGRRVMSGEIAPADFVKMSQDELKSQEHKERDSKLEKENMLNAQVAQPEKSISDALTCGKCGQKKVSYSQAQTRSADEPMTTFCECLSCGNRWKVCDSRTTRSACHTNSHINSSVVLVSTRRQTADGIVYGPYTVLRHSVLGRTHIIMMCIFTRLLIELQSRPLPSKSFMEGVCGVSGASPGQDKLISKRDFFDLRPRSSSLGILLLSRRDLVLSSSTAQTFVSRSRPGY